VEQGVVLERGVEVRLAVEDRDRDVVAALEERLQLVGRADRDRLEPGVSQLVGDDLALRGRGGRSRSPVAPRVRSPIG
jgi:hypothetical protein